MSFRVNTFSVSSESFSCPAVRLSKDFSSENYFTVLIGNNGTGKSRFATNLVNVFIEMHENKKRMRFDYNLEYQLLEEKFSVKRRVGDRGFKEDKSFGVHPKLPNKLIAISTSLSDKFPSGRYGQHRHFENRLNLKKEFYAYLGTRHRMAGSSSRALMDRAISTMLQNINEDDNGERYREIFSYLDYEPVIKLSYRVYVPEYLRNYVGFHEFGGVELKSLLKDWSSRRGGFRSEFYQKAADFYSESYWNDLAAMYMETLSESNQDKKNAEYSFVVNFSVKNSRRKK